MHYTYFQALHSILRTRLGQIDDSSRAFALVLDLGSVYAKFMANEYRDSPELTTELHLIRDRIDEALCQQIRKAIG
jgi:hypothetical protein